MFFHDHWPRFRLLSLDGNEMVMFGAVPAVLCLPLPLPGRPVARPPAAAIPCPAGTGRPAHVPVRAGGPPEAGIGRITVASPSLVFHPMAPLGGKESTQRCHSGETRFPLNAPRRRARPVPQGP